MMVWDPGDVNAAPPNGTDIVVFWKKSHQFRVGVLATGDLHRCLLFPATSLAADVGDIGGVAGRGSTSARHFLRDSCFLLGIIANFLYAN